MGRIDSAHHQRFPQNFFAASAVQSQGENPARVDGAALKQLRSRWSVWAIHLLPRDLYKTFFSLEASLLLSVA